MRPIYNICRQSRTWDNERTHKEKIENDLFRVAIAEVSRALTAVLPETVFSLSIVRVIVLPFRLAIYCRTRIASSSRPVDTRYLEDSWSSKITYRNRNIPNVRQPLLRWITRKKSDNITGEVVECTCIEYLRRWIVRESGFTGTGPATHKENRHPVSAA